MPATSVVATRMKWRIGATEGLARGNGCRHLARIMHGAGVASAGASSASVIEAGCLAWIVIAAGPRNY